MNVKSTEKPFCWELMFLWVQREIRNRSTLATSLNLNVNTTVYLEVIHLMFVPTHLLLQRQGLGIKLVCMFLNERKIELKVQLYNTP